MSHDTTKVLMGSVGSNYAEVDSRKGAIAAGLAVRLKSDETLSVAQADGELLGISLGKDLSDAGFTAICRKGLRVPIQLTASFNPAIGAVVAISDTTGMAIGYTGSGDRYVNAVYASGRIGGSGVNGGITEVDGAATVGVAYIDFQGGL